ncbi:dihydroorotate dehydrogenase [Eubacteriales bacterium OttesenSCG-928-K08]|nr:dihydroorotate dehydrogenase [Eubacteriales bacterium OttesenSCG-928-K08]
MSEKLLTTILGVELKNPVIAASGTFGFGREYSELIDVSRLGGISSKGLTLKGSLGNSGRRLLETPAGMLNSIGLENPGVDTFVRDEAPYMRELGPVVIANLGGHSEQDYVEGAKMLNHADIDILELNISCPNVKEGGMAFGLIPESAAKITKLVKENSRHPLLVKLSPNVTSIVEVALACEEAGANGISLVNTFLGMAIDVEKKEAVFENVYAGLSGPAIRPIALRMVHEVKKHVKIDVVGMGGIMNTIDALAFLMAGASAVQVGSATFANPETMLKIIDGLEEYCQLHNLNNISEICGII